MAAEEQGQFSTVGAAILYLPDLMTPRKPTTLDVKLLPFIIF